MVQWEVRVYEGTGNRDSVSHYVGVHRCTPNDMANFHQRPAGVAPRFDKLAEQNAWLCINEKDK